MRLLRLNQMRLLHLSLMRLLHVNLMRFLYVNLMRMKATACRSRISWRPGSVLNGTTSWRWCRNSVIY